MLNFFRKIRLRLLSTKSLGKYLLYAVGEILLVVIGILIAVQINNLNELQKEVVREIKMLSDLQNDIAFNIENIKEGLTYLREGAAHSQNMIFAFDNQLQYDSSIIKSFQFYDYFWDPDFRYASFENLKKEGVNLISNDSLRNSIIELYEIDMDILDVSDLNRLNSFMTSVGDKIINKYLYINNDNGEVLPFDYEEMMSDEAFYSFVSYTLSRQKIATYKSEDFVAKAASLIQFIDQEKELLK